jgi:hypothetical protein
MARYSRLNDRSRWFHIDARKVAELVIIPNGLSRLAGQAMRLVRRLLALSCSRLCGWGRQPVAQFAISLTRPG